MRRNTAARVILVCVVLGLTTSVHGDMVVQTCFSPQGKCSAHILREIEEAKKELLVAVYAFTSDDLAGALVRARKRGLSVQVILDRDFDADNDKSKGKFLEDQKILVRRLPATRSAAADKESGLMHQKFAVIDRKMVFTGSYNWTQAADNLNDENLLLFRDAGSLAEEYRKVFLQMWERKR
jgi:phosphatidylserine/phosphatidylglycerophosphate/cardiolipin synthase-like enzyme